MAVPSWRWFRLVSDALSLEIPEPGFVRVAPELIRKALFFHAVLMPYVEEPRQEEQESHPKYKPHSLPLAHAFGGLLFRVLTGIGNGLPPIIFLRSRCNSAVRPRSAIAASVSPDIALATRSSAMSSGGRSKVALERAIWPACWHARRSSATPGGSLRIWSGLGGTRTLTEPRRDDPLRGLLKQRRTLLGPGGTWAHPPRAYGGGTPPPGSAEKQKGRASVCLPPPEAEHRGRKAQRERPVPLCT